MTDDLVVERHGYVQLVIISRPEKMNSLDFAAHERLIEIWRQFDADEQARVAVLTGTGDQAFCAGADLKTYTMVMPGARHRSSGWSTRTNPD